MKNLLKTLVFVLLIVGVKAQTSNFTVTNISGTYTLTCSQTAISFSASTHVFGPVSFQWASSTNSVIATTVSVTLPGNYTVTALDSLNNPFGTQYFSIVSNTLAPASIVNPSSQTITCSTPLASAVTASGSVNLTHSFISPFGTTVVSTQAAASYTPAGPGTYTHVILDNINGCTGSSTFILTSNQGYPTFSVSSPHNYTLGCNTKSVALIMIINAATTPTAGGPVSHTLMSSIMSSTVPGSLSATTVYSVNIPGLYYVIVKDNTNGCLTQIPLSILSNTFQPDISVTVPTQILNCNTPQINLQGSSNTSNVTYLWSFIGTPGNIVSSAILVSSQPAVPTLTTINSYTFSVKDVNNDCKSFSVIPVYQNLFKPTAAISTGGSYTLTCAQPSIVLTNQSTSGIPPSTGFPMSQQVAGYAWLTPPATTASLGMSSTYTTSVAGEYTLIALDLNNGCKDTATVMIYGGCNTVGIQDNQDSRDLVKLYPNPAQGQFTLISENLHANTGIEIYNVIGELIMKQTLQHGSELVNIDQLLPGIYYVRVVHDRVLIHTLKLMHE